jgi:transcriptional regulator with XRE-family HTH domain
MIGFEIIRQRLIEALRLRIRAGEITERALARKAGISQPHLHNILKGVRALNPETADQLLETLGITVTDLLHSDELRRALFLIGKNAEPAVEVPVLHNRIGPGLPWTDQPSPFERVSVPYLRVSRMQNPLVARLGDDPAMTPLLAPGDLVLLDFSEEARASDEADALFAVESRGNVGIRWVRRGRGRIYLIGLDCLNAPLKWEVAEDDAVRARATTLRSMYPTELVYDPLLPPRDTLPTPVGP